MDKLLNLIGKDARRITFCIQNESNYYLLYSVIELLLPDMQDFNDYKREGGKYIFRSEASNSSKPYNVYMTIDWITIDEAFLREPYNNFCVYGTPYKFYSNGYRLRPALDELPYIMNDSYHDSTNELQKVLPLRQCSKALYSFISNDDIASSIINENDYLRKQLQEVSINYYGADLSLFPDHYGNIYIVQYNPYFRQVDFVSSPEPKGLYVNFKFRRPELPKLLIRISSKNRAGFYSFEKDEEIDCSHNSYFIEMPSSPEILSIKIFDQKGALIYYSDNMSFIHAINLNMNMKSKDVVLNYDDGNGSKKITVEKFVSESHTIGQSGMKDAIFNEKETRNAYLILEQSLQFVLFDGDKNKKEENLRKAKDCVKRILNKARNRCIICDPYFNLRDLYEFVFNISSLSVDIRILSSKEFLAKNAEEGAKVASKINDEISKYHNHVGGSIQFRLLKGQSPLHDRFIVVDDEVWLLGSSFNEFGNRATTIVKVPQVSARRVYSMAEEWWSDNRISMNLTDYGRN